jgi:hypothetical protein
MCFNRAEIYFEVQSVGIGLQVKSVSDGHGGVAGRLPCCEPRDCEFKSQVRTCKQSWISGSPIRALLGLMTVTRGDVY